VCLLATVDQEPAHDLTTPRATVRLRKLYTGDKNRIAVLISRSDRSALGLFGYNFGSANDCGGLLILRVQCKGY
jgi:hypothetical protein